MKHPTLPRSCLGLLLAAIWLGACRGEAAPPTPTPIPTPSASALQLKTFETLWQAVRDGLVYEDFGGADWEAVGDRYRRRVEAGLTADEFSQAMAEMLEELPPGLARYESRAQRIQTDTTDESNYQGIGAFVSFRKEPEPHVVLLVVMEGSPARAAGLMDHDSIYAVDGEPVRLEEGLGVVNRIRGPADSTVTLTVQSPGGERRDVTVRRAAITAGESLRGGRLPALDVGYLRVPPVADEQLAQLFAQALVSFSEDSPMRALIIDLRVAGSGGAWPLEEMLTLFADGAVGEFYSRQGAQPQRVAGQDVAGSQSLRLAILIGPDTQGVPEIFAGVLQGMGRATLIGLPTPGEIELPTEYPLPDGSRAFVATSSFRDASGRDLGLQGVAPDQPVDADWDKVSLEDDPVLLAALEALTR